MVVYCILIEDFIFFILILLVIIISNLELILLVMREGFIVIDVFKIWFFYYMFFWIEIICKIGRILVILFMYIYIS